MAGRCDVFLYRSLKVLDEYYDCVICPENQVLKYTTTDREGYKEFKSNGGICNSCKSKQICTESTKGEKVAAKHIWWEYLEKAEDYRHTFGIKELYEKRKETIERVFADSKEKHSMRFTYYQGLAQVGKWVRLKFAAMNLKKYAIHR
ncbi:MAG: transposase [Firmicutes bacterium]|nr:transposase [Bacillota bacterium]